MNDQLLELLVWQQQRELARVARTRRTVGGDETDECAGVDRGPRPRRTRTWGLRLARTTGA